MRIKMIKINSRFFIIALTIDFIIISHNFAGRNACATHIPHSAVRWYVNRGTVPDGAGEDGGFAAGVGLPMVDLVAEDALTGRLVERFGADKRLRGHVSLASARMARLVDTALQAECLPQEPRPPCPKLAGVELRVWAAGFELRVFADRRLRNGSAVAEQEEIPAGGSVSREGAAAEGVNEADRLAGTAVPNDILESAQRLQEIVR